MRRNIDAWWPAIASGAEAIVNSASGCGSMLVEYGELLANDPTYAEKARQVSALTRDIGEILLQEDLGKLAIDTGIGKVAVHTPCTLQHALRLPHLVPQLLQRAGFKLAQTTDDHLCCGSAGTYSILQSSISARLRDNKLAALGSDDPNIIVTANIGCQLQLQSAADTPVMHWIELFDPA
jgi:glycolate oxidase iron-sulfur subunit